MHISFRPPFAGMYLRTQVEHLTVTALDRRRPAACIAFARIRLFLRLVFAKNYIPISRKCEVPACAETVNS